MKRIILVGLLALAGCDKEPVRSERTDNTEIQVDDLFTHRGCTVSRFYDGGRAHYFADCRGAVTTTRVETCGKGCTRRRDYETPTFR
jgi:hypothetical protein